MRPSDALPPVAKAAERVDEPEALLQGQVRQREPAVSDGAVQAAVIPHALRDGEAQLLVGIHAHHNNLSSAPLGGLGEQALQLLQGCSVGLGAL
eukprot:1411962-Lingulodinium_polyedra.AAC.1